MSKILICIALVLVAVVAARRVENQGHDGRGPGGSGGSGGSGGHGGAGSDHGNKGQWETKLCANGSSAQSFLSQTQQLITDLQSNGTYTSVLQKRAQEIAYIQNTNNAALLTSNCTSFFSGLDNARNLDQQAGEQQKQSERTVAKLFFQIISSLVGGSSSENDD